MSSSTVQKMSFLNVHIWGWQTCTHRRRLRGGRGGHVPTTIYNLNFVPTTFKNVQTNCDQKIPTYSTETVKSKSCDRRDDIITAAHRQSGTGWPSGGSGDFLNGRTSRPAVILYLRKNSRRILFLYFSLTFFLMKSFPYALKAVRSACSIAYGVSLVSTL